MLKRIEGLCQDEQIGVHLVWELSRDPKVVKRFKNIWKYRGISEPADFIARIGYCRVLDDLAKTAGFDRKHELAVADQKARKEVLELMDTALWKLIRRIVLWRNKRKPPRLWLG
jgi:hypothetical protein